MADDGIVDENVDCPQPGDCRLYQLLHGARYGKVCPVVEHGHTCPPFEIGAFRPKRLCRFEAIQHHRAPGERQRLGDGEPQALGRSRHQRGPALQGGGSDRTESGFMNCHGSDANRLNPAPTLQLVPLPDQGH